MMKWTLILFMTVTSISVRAQEILNGLVADSATFAPLPYVTVQVKSKNKGTITDANGNFRIVASATDTLVFQYLGYHTLEVPAEGWEGNLILLSENVTVLRTVTIRDSSSYGYEDLFREQNEQLEEANRKLPFYYSKAKKQKLRVGRLQQENLRVKTYVEVIIQNEDNKKRLMKEYNLTEAQYYETLAGFNAKNFMVMYYLTAGELISLLNNYFSAQHNKG